METICSIIDKNYAMLAIKTQFQRAGHSRTSGMLYKHQLFHVSRQLQTHTIWLFAED